MNKFNQLAQPLTYAHMLNFFQHPYDEILKQVQDLRGGVQ